MMAAAINIRFIVIPSDKLAAKPTISISLEIHEDQVCVLAYVAESALTNTYFQALSIKGSDRPVHAVASYLQAVTESGALLPGQGSTPSVLLITNESHRGQTMRHGELKKISRCVG